MIRRKRAAPSSSTPLCNDLFMEMVLSYVGSGQGLYVSAVSRSWRTKYRALCSASASSQQQSCGQHVHSGSCTSYSAVFSSKSRIQLALVHGLQLDADNHKLQRAAESADLVTLQAARALGLSMTSEVAHAAAAASSWAKLRWCIEQNCPLSDDVSAAVAAAGCAVGQASAVPVAARSALRLGPHCVQCCSTWRPRQLSALADGQPLLWTAPLRAALLQCCSCCWSKACL
jgi:hypothetical protein